MLPQLEPSALPEKMKRPARSALIRLLSILEWIVAQLEEEIDRRERQGEASSQEMELEEGGCPE